MSINEFNMTSLYAIILQMSILFAQGGESFDLAQDREPFERPVEPRVKPGMTKTAICEVFSFIIF
jgi:hypothetical protein